MSVLINPYALAPRAPAVTREYRALKSASDQNALTITASACDIGAPAVGRHVFAMFFFGVDGADRTVVSATIGGAAAKVHAQAKDTYVTARYYATLLSAPLDAGTTADVSVTLNSSRLCQLIRCATYKVTGLQSDVPIDTASGNAAAGAIDVEEDGLLIGGLFTRNGGSNINATGWTEDFEASTTGTTRVFGASLGVVATQAGYGFAVSDDGGLVAGSFR